MKPLLTLFILLPSLLFSQSFDTVAIEQEVDSLTILANSLANKLEFDKAFETNAKAEKLALEKMGRISKAYGTACIYKANIFRKSENLEEAEKWYMESEEVLKQAVGKAHPEYAKCLAGYSTVYSILGEYEESEQMQLKALAIREKVFGKGSKPYARSINNLGVLYWYMELYEKAEPLFLESIAIKAKTYGKESSVYANSVGNTAMLYFTMGKYEKAEPLYKETLALTEAAIGKEHPNYANDLNNMGNLYTSMYNYEKAEALFLEALAIEERTLGKENKGYALALHNLAVTYFEQGLVKKAEPLYLEAKSIREKIYGKKHEAYAGSLIDLGNLYRNLGDLEKTESYLLEAKNYFEKDAPTRMNSFYFNCLGNLASLYLDMGQIDKAAPLYLEAQKLRGELLGTDHPDYETSLYNIGRLYERQGNLAASDSSMMEYLRLSQSRINRSITFLSEKELGKYTSKYLTEENRMLSYLIKRKNNKEDLGLLPSLTYDLILYQKGFLMNIANRLNKLAVSSPASKEIHTRLKGYQRRLASEYAKPLNKQIGVEELKSKANDTEKELARLIAGYEEEAKQVKWQEVQAILKKDEVAIEFVQFKSKLKKDSGMVQYAAFILRPDISTPLFIPLFDEPQLIQLLKKSNDSTSNYTTNLYTVAQRNNSSPTFKQPPLYDLIWRPLEKELKNINTIYYSPAGLLHRINIGAVVLNETEIVADRYLLLQMVSTRQLVGRIKNN